MFPGDGCWAMSGDIFSCCNKGKGCFGSWWAKARDASKHSTMCRSAPPTAKKYPAPNGKGQRLKNHIIEKLEMVHRRLMFLLYHSAPLTSPRCNAYVDRHVFPGPLFQCSSRMPSPNHTSFFVSL